MIKTEKESERERERERSGGLSIFNEHSPQGFTIEPFVNQVKTIIYTAGRAAEKVLYVKIIKTKQVKERRPKQDLTGADDGLSDGLWSLWGIEVNGELALT